MRKEEIDQDDYLDGPVIDESLLTAKELLGLQQAEERLKRDYIYRLKKVAVSEIHFFFFFAFWLLMGHMNLRLDIRYRNVTYPSIFTCSVKKMNKDEKSFNKINIT